MLRNIEFLGHDEQGKAVFWDHDYPSGAPRTIDLTTHKAAWTSPDVFRVSKAHARLHFGEDYAELGRGGSTLIDTSWLRNEPAETVWGAVPEPGSEQAAKAQTQRGNGREMSQEEGRGMGL